MSEFQVPVTFADGSWMYLRTAIIANAVRFVDRKDDPVDVVISEGNNPTASLVFANGNDRDLMTYRGAEVIEKTFGTDVVQALKMDGEVLVGTSPHPFTTWRTDGTFYTVPKGILVRIESEIVDSGKKVGGTPLVHTRPGSLMGLPGREPGLWFLGAMPIAQAAAQRERDDVLGPVSSNDLRWGTIKDSRGRPAVTMGWTNYLLH